MMSNGSGSQGQRCFYMFLHDFLNGPCHFYSINFSHPPQTMELLQNALNTFFLALQICPTFNFGGIP